MNEYVIHAKLKNNLLLSRILEKHSTVNQFCRAHDLCPSVVGLFVNLQKRAILDSGAWTVTALRLADALGVLPEELFTDEQRAAELRTNSVFIEVSGERLREMGDFCKGLEDKDLCEKLLSTSPLTSREKYVVLAHTMGDETLDEVAKTLNVGRERVRQIEAKALRRLRRRVQQLGEVVPFLSCPESA